MLRSVMAGRRRVLALFSTVGIMIVLGLAVIAPPMAVGQATRTWVSGVGDDANPCSRTAPCKTFAGAISKTATGGEINCLDPGGFGGVTIVKSITIDCTGTLGGVLSAGAGVNGIVINLPSATDHVALRGLDMNGAGNAQNGIRIVSGGQVEVDDSVIRGYRAANGLGMSIQPAGVLELTVRNTSIISNGTSSATPGSGNGGGILIQPTGAGGSAKVALINVNLSNNGNGLRIDTTGNTSAAGVDISIDGSSATHNSNHGFAGIKSATGSPVDMVIMDSVASYNGQSGVLCSGLGCIARIGGMLVTGNGTGTNPLSSGIIESYQTSQIQGNTSNGTRTNILGE